MQGSLSRSDLPGGSTIFWPGQRAESVFVLERGVVALQRVSPVGEAVGLYLVRSGELFGEEALFDRPVGCVAETLVPSAVARLPVAGLRDVLRHHPEDAWNLAAQLQARTARLVDRVEQLATGGVYSRLVHVLLELAESLGHRDGDGVLLLLPVSQARLASLVGTSRQSVNQLLGRLEAEGLIARSRMELRLLRVEALRAVAGGPQAAPFVPPAPANGRDAAAGA